MTAETRAQAALQAGPTPAQSDVLLVHGPQVPECPLVLDSPHSGFRMPADFGACLPLQDLRDGEDQYIDELWMPAAALGIPLLAAQFPRTYIDANRHAGDVDLDLLEESWPHEHVPSGKAALGKALVWRLMDDGRPIYDRRLSVLEVASRIERYHAPYHRTLRQLLDAAHGRFGRVLHLNCHSMNPVGGAMGEGGAGRPRADFVLGDRDGSSCSADCTQAVAEHLRGLGYEVKINDPFKGVELVRAYSDPAQGRHSLQVEINKRVYMNPQSGEKLAHFAVLQRELMGLLEHLRHLDPS